jgi:hypothetical protein
MNNLQLLLGFILAIGILVLVFYNYLYVGRVKEREYLIRDTLDISQTYQQTIQLNELFDITSRDAITLSGTPEGEGLTFIWNMYIPYYTPERIWFTSYNKDKPILRIGDSPQIVFNPKDASLKVQVKYKSTQFTSHFPVIELKDIPMQKWNRFIVIIKSNEVKVYLNGDTKIHKKLANPIIINNQDIEIGEINNNMIGQIRDFELVFRPLDIYEVRKEF